MGEDDSNDDGCAPGGHAWRLAGVEFREDGSWSEYRCSGCEGCLWVTPGGMHPTTA